MKIESGASRLQVFVGRSFQHARDKIDGRASLNFGKIGDRHLLLARQRNDRICRHFADPDEH